MRLLQYYDRLNHHLKVPIEKSDKGGYYHKVKEQKRQQKQNITHKEELLV